MQPGRITIIDERNDLLSDGAEARVSCVCFGWR